MAYYICDSFRGSGAYWDIPSNVKQKVLQFVYLIIKKAAKYSNAALANTALSGLESYVENCQCSVRTLSKKGHVQAIVEAVLQLGLMEQELSAGDKDTCGSSDKSQRKSFKADN